MLNVVTSDPDAVWPAEPSTSGGPGKPFSKPYRVVRNYCRGRDQEWEDHVVDTYAKWLNDWRNLRSDKGMYHLVIAVADPDRASMLKAGWGNAARDILEWLTTKVNALAGIHVLHTYAAPAGKDCGSAGIERVVMSSQFPDVEPFRGKVLLDKKARLLLFDNHGNVRQYLEYLKCTETRCASSPFWQPTGNYTGASLRLFSLLERPPDTSYILKLLLLSLFEAALTRVLVVDERVAESLVDASPRYDRDALSAAGVHAPGVLVIGDCRAFVSESLKLRADAGVQLWEVGLPLTNESRYDVAVLHQGVVDERLKGDSSWFDALTASADHLVMTSGRGHYIKDLPIAGGGQGMPFIEFSALKENIMDDFSKYHLTRVLTTAKGDYQAAQPKP
jgi:hypothetical protein